MVTRSVAAGSAPARWARRSAASPRPRVRISYWCANGHETKPSFAEDTRCQMPETWDCPRCGCPPVRTGEPAVGAATEPYKTHLAYVKERRSDTDGAAILDEALAKLRGR